MYDTKALLATIYPSIVVPKGHIELISLSSTKSYIQHSHKFSKEMSRATNKSFKVIVEWHNCKKSCWVGS
jgi:hypothetical protein